MTERITRTEPTIRVRMNHDFTVKDGWRLKETTVEWEGSVFGLDPETLAMNLMEFSGAVYNAGMRVVAEREAARLNAIEAFEQGMNDDR